MNKSRGELRSTSCNKRRGSMKQTIKQYSLPSTSLLSFQNSLHFTSEHRVQAGQPHCYTQPEMGVIEATVPFSIDLHLRKCQSPGEGT